MPPVLPPMELIRIALEFQRTFGVSKCVRISICNECSKGNIPFVAINSLRYSSNFVMYDFLDFDRGDFGNRTSF